MMTWFLRRMPVPLCDLRPDWHGDRDSESVTFDSGSLSQAGSLGYADHVLDVYDHHLRLRVENPSPSKLRVPAQKMVGPILTSIPKSLVKYFPRAAYRCNTACYPFWGSVPIRSFSSVIPGIITKRGIRNMCAGADYHRPGRMELSSAFGSIVKVFTVAASPNWFMPWQTKQQRETTGSGFIIDGRR